LVYCVGNKRRLPARRKKEASGYSIGKEIVIVETKLSGGGGGEEKTKRREHVSQAEEKKNNHGLSSEGEGGT